MKLRPKLCYNARAMRDTSTYRYRIWFTDDSLWPWSFTVYKDDQPMDVRTGDGQTGRAMTEWGARHYAKRYTRNHRKHRGTEYEVTA